MEETEMTALQGQEEVDKWFDGLPTQLTECLSELENLIAQIETFDLLSYISFYNHLHRADQYRDYREDRMFVVSELIALITLRHNYITTSSVDFVKAATLAQEVQKLGHKYHGLASFHQMRVKNPSDHHSLEGVAYKNMRDETTIRNPALPEHHLEFSQELYNPLDTTIKEKFGFSIKDSIELREGIFSLINTKINAAKVQVEKDSLRLAMEVYKYRSTKVVEPNSFFDENALKELNKLSRKQILESCYNYCTNEMYYRFGNTYCFTSSELSEHLTIDPLVAEHFLTQFSCTYPAIGIDINLVSTNSILKSKPLIFHQNRYLLPSFPLLNWAVEPIIEGYIKSVPKLQNRFKDIKHEFLLKKSNELFSQLLKGRGTIHENLFYHDGTEKDSLCETDGLIIYERTLLIIEAKGHRISQPAKDGKILRTEKHLDEIVKESYKQGVRTLNYIKSKPRVEFSTGNKKIIHLEKADFDEYLIISLALEPIGSITPLIRATNELGYFAGNIFPWIISIYDLIVIADHLESPIFLLHYIRRRKEFLERKVMETFEEIDLLSYYLSNRLYIEEIFKEAEEKQVNMVYLDNETDDINNYYMHKYSLKNADPPKLKIKLPGQISKIISALENARFSHRQEIMLRLLDISPYAMNMFCDYIKKIKNMYKQDGKKHDCAIITHIWGQKVGFTFMAGPDKLELDKSLYYYCQYKLDQQKADVWMGFGDIQRSTDEFSIQSAIIIKHQ